MPPEVNEKLSADLSEQVIHGEQSEVISVTRLGFLFSSILIKGG